MSNYISQFGVDVSLDVFYCLVNMLRLEQNAHHFYTYLNTFSFESSKVNRVCSYASKQPRVIGSGSGWVPSVNLSLFEPVLSKIQDAIWYHLSSVG